MNANGKRPRSESVSTEGRPSRTIVALLAAGKIDRKYELAVGRFKLTSRFAERELQNPNSIHKRGYLLELQGNLRQIKARLERQHPDEFHEVFEAVNVMQEQIQRYSERKAFAQRMQRFLREQQEVEDYTASVAAGENTRKLNVEWRQRLLDEQREQLIEESPEIFDRMLEQWDSKKRACVFSRPFHEEWGDV